MENASDTSTATMDYSAASERIGSLLGEDLTGKLNEPNESPGLDHPEPSPPAVTAQPTPEPIKTYDVPKSWKREMHDHWGKITPDAQAYIIEREKQLLDGFQTFRPIQDALTPHRDFLAKQNIAPAQAVAYLLNAQRQLMEGTPEQRMAAYQKLGRDLQLIQEAAQNGTPSTPVDPAIQSIQQRQAALEQQLQAQLDAQKAAIKAENMKIIEAFADEVNKDGTKAHPYFDEVADEVAILIREKGLSLQDAYPVAVRMNPVVWEKEQARLLTEHEAKIKENARLTSLPKKKAASVNIKSNGDGREPTEPLGSFEDTIKRNHQKIKERGSA